MALAAPTDHKMLWPRERRWPLQLIKECYGRARGAGRSNGSLTLLVACEQVICRQISWWRCSVLARADTRIRPLSSSPTLVAVIVLTVPRAQKREDQRAAGSPAALTQLALCLRLASILRPKADNAPQPSMTRPHNEDYVKYRCGVSNLFIAFASSSSG